MRAGGVSSLLVLSIRVAAWVLLVAIVALTLAPPKFRPLTLAPHMLEHAGIFLLTGTAFGFGYKMQRKAFFIGALAFGATLELTQSFVPGRHARLSDFLIDAIAGATGVILGASFSGTCYRRRK